MTLMSGKVYSDAGTPSNTIGDQGDIFMQLDGLKTTYRKEGGAWTPIGNQLGTIPEFLKGVGVPPNVLGQDNQYYREVNTDAIYEKQAGVWTNIASWTSLEIQQLLLSNGIGADLAVTNHVSNIDTFIEAGAEGYFDNTTTGTKPSTYGLVKARRESSLVVYQSSHCSLVNKWSTRQSVDGGANWGDWRTTANEDGDATRKFKALTGVADDDVAVVSQLPSVPDFFGSTYNYLATGETLTIPPLGVRRIVIIGGGGGTAGYEQGNGGNGGESRLNVQGSGTLIAKGLGGLGSLEGQGAPYHGVRDARGRNGTEFNGDYTPFILSVSRNDPDLIYLSKVAGYGQGGGRDTGYIGVPNVLEAGEAGHGGVLEFILKNNSTNIPLVLVATVGVGGVKNGGNANNGAAGVIAYRT